MTSRLTALRIFTFRQSGDDPCVGRTARSVGRVKSRHHRPFRRSVYIQIKMKIIPRLVPLLLLVAVATAADSKPPKNFVLILADDLGWADTTLYGKTSLYETPNIERLAARGMTFSSAYASPICSPTRASIMTGQNPARHGMTAPAAHLEAERFEAVASENGPPHQKCTNVRTATRLDPDLPMLGKVLKDAGYATAHFGKWHLGREPHSPLERGFDVDLPHWWGPGPKSGYLAPWGYANPNFKEGAPGDHIEDRMASEAVAWLNRRDRSKPFFMNYWQFSVHAPFGAKPELIERYRKKLGTTVAGLSEPSVRKKLLNSHQPEIGLPQQSPTYAAMVHSLDDAVGSLLDAIDAEGIADDTVIVFYSDNGGNIHCGLEETASSGKKYITPITSNHPLRGGKGGIHEGGVRVPAVVVWPGVTKPGSRSDVRIQATDLYPTILRMLNVDLPTGHPIDGVDFAKALRGEEMDRGPMFTLVPGHGTTPHWLPPSMSVHHGDWKLIRTFHYGEDGNHEYRLYNLREDIGENRNLAATYPDRVKELDKLIEDYIAEANVVVPLPNPNFDPAKFDPSRIGVQPGGLKMPAGFQASAKGERFPSGTVNKTSILGWTARDAAASVEGESLRIGPAGRQPFIANAKLRVSGPVEFRLRIKPPKNGKARLQWRTEGQDRFPETGQRMSFDVDGGDWQELSVTLPIEGQLVHMRFFLSDSKQPTEIDWIEIGSKAQTEKDAKRWDFNVAAEQANRGPRARPIPPTQEQPVTQPAPRAIHPPNVPRPNVLLILADDLGYGDVGCYGAPDVRTPVMDRLATEGVRCTDGYAAFPVCSPSRAALLTGRYPARFGPTYEDYYGGGSPNLDPTEHPTIGQMMKDAGYRTACFGKWNVSNLNRRRANDFGFNRWVGLHLNHDYYTHKLERTGELDLYEEGKPLNREGVWSDTIFADEAIRFIRAESDKPFFIYLPFQAPHTPIQDPDIPLDKPRDKKKPENRVTLIKMIERLDLEIGRVLKELDDQGISEETLVILTSDNGGAQTISRNLPLSGAKQMLLEGGIRVPLILRWPGVLPKGTLFSSPVTAMDLTATVAAAGNAKPHQDKPFDGVDLLPALTGEAELPADRPLFFRRRTVSVRNNQNLIRQSAVRQGDWKYLRTYDMRDNSRFTAALYNLRDDVAEKRDLAESQSEKLRSMSDLLEAWELEMSRTAIPFVPASRARK